MVFDAFGNETEKAGTSANTYGFQGEERDATGLYYLRARYMDPTSGTFTSMDTYAGSLSDPMSLHKYLFANSNPVMYSDPSGHYSLAKECAVMGCIGAIAGALSYTIDALVNDPEMKSHSISGLFQRVLCYAIIAIAAVLFIHFFEFVIAFIGALLDWETINLFKNQGIVHFFRKELERLQGIMNRLGYDGSTLKKNCRNFIDFTNKTLAAVEKAKEYGQFIVDDSDPNKVTFYLKSVVDNRYVAIVEYKGKIASIMSTDWKYIVTHFMRSK